jgi:hypothetical protein
MIPFEKSFLGLSTLTPTSLARGAIPRVLIPAFISVGISVCVFWTGLDESMVSLVPDWKVYTIFASVTGSVSVDSLIAALFTARADTAVCQALLRY